MKAWVQQDFQPVGTDYEGNNLYGYVCIIPQSEEEIINLLHFLEDNGEEVDWDEQ